MANQCKHCAHYDNCGRRQTCNSFVSKEDAYQSEMDVARCKREYREYREEYYCYAADDRD